MARSIVNRFDGAIVNDPRDPASNVARVVSNFDIISKPGSLLPYRSSEDGNSNAANDLMRTWCLALGPSSAYKLYGLGRQTASNKVRVFYKNLTTGASNDLSDNGWTETANNLATQTTPSYECFVYYKNQGLIFGLHGGRYIWSYDPLGSAGFGDTLFDLTSFTNCAQGIVHSKDDKLYIPVDNKIYVKDAANAFVLGLTLPSQYYVTSICEFNNYIAIGSAPVAGVGNSRVFIWDRSTSLTTVNESVDWGYGLIKVLDEIGGYLVGISLDGGGVFRFNDRITFRYYTGSGSISFKEILGASGGTLLTWKQKINNRIYFMMNATLNGSVREGVWSFGKNLANQWNLIHERTPNNDTATSSQPLRGFFYVGDYLFQGYTTAGSAGAVSKTDDQATYSATSIYESKINPGNMPEADKILQKQLLGVRMTYSPLGAAGQVVLKYRVDSTGSYTTVFTETTDNVQYTEMGDAGGVPFTAGRDYEFRIESTGGAEVTGFEYDYKVIPT